MVIKQNNFSSISTIKWIGSHDTLPPTQIPAHLAYKNIYFYQKCIFGPLTLTVGDYVLVSNADSAEPDSISGCDIAKILMLYELREMSNRDPCRAIVQWYSRPQAVPHKHFDNDDICIDFNCEVIEEHRPYDSDISIETVFRKCSVINGRLEDCAVEILNKFNVKKTSINSCPMFVCRYKFIKVKNSYRLVPLQFSNESQAVTEAATATEAQVRKNRKTMDERSMTVNESSTNGKLGGSERKAKSSMEEKRRRRASVAAANAVEFIDINFLDTENKVSPIKIVGGRSVVRLSAKKQTFPPSASKQHLNQQSHMVSPLAEQNIKVVTPVSRASAARRNLNLSLDNDGANTTADSDCLNYSIVKNTPESNATNDMKIKLRLSER